MSLLKELFKNLSSTKIQPKYSGLLKTEFLTGSPLDITDASREITRGKKFILVDKNNILETGISEISSITNF